MNRPDLSPSEIAERGRRLYEDRIRAVVETEENIGRLVAIDVETGDYEIGDAPAFAASAKLRERHPGAAIFKVRIGYNAVYAIGGVLERTRQ